MSRRRLVTVFCSECRRKVGGVDDAGDGTLWLVSAHRAPVPLGAVFKPVKHWQCPTHGWLYAFEDNEISRRVRVAKAHYPGRSIPIYATPY